MVLEGVDIFSRGRELVNRDKEESETLGAKRKAEQDRLGRDFEKFQEAVKKGKKSTGDLIQDWFVVNYINFPTPDSGTDTLISRWQEAYKKSKDFVAQPIGSFEQLQRRVCTVHTFTGEGNEYALNTDERFRIGILEGEFQFDVAQGRILIPARKHVVWTGPQMHREEMTETIDGGIIFDKPGHLFIERFGDYSALGNEVKERYGRVDWNEHGKNGLLLLFGIDELQDKLKRFGKSRAYGIVRAIGAERLLPDDFRADYHRDMVELASTALAEVDGFRKREAKLIDYIKREDLVKAAKEGRDLGYHDGDHWCPNPAKNELARTQVSLDEVRGKIRTALSGIVSKGVLSVELPLSLVKSGAGDVDLRDRVRSYCLEYQVDLPA